MLDFTASTALAQAYIDNVPKFQSSYVHQSFALHLRHLHPPLIQVYGRAAALLYALHPFLPGARRLARAHECVRDGGERFGFAGGARLKGAVRLVDVPRDVEGVALAVAEAVYDGSTQAALLVYRLLQRLRFAPVHLQVPTLRDVQRLLTGFQDVLGGGRRWTHSAGNKSSDRGLVRPLGFVRVVFVGMRKSTMESPGICTSQTD